MTEPEALEKAIESAESALAGAEHTARIPAHHLRALVDAARRWPFDAADVSWLEHRIRELEQKIGACAVGAPMRDAFQEEITFWKHLRDRIARRISNEPGGESASPPHTQRP